MKRATMLGSAILILAGATQASAEKADDLLAMYDLNGNGKLDSDEKAVILRDADIISRRPKEEAKKKPASKADGPPADNDLQSTFLLRDQFASGAYLSSGEKISDAGALFTYTNDGKKHEEALAVKGSLMYALIGDTGLQFSGDPESTRISHIAFITGTELDAKLSPQDNKIEGSAALQAGLELEVLTGGIFPTQYWKGAAVYTTDFEEGASVLGAELMWHPIADLLPIGKTWSLSEDLGAWLTFEPTLNLDYSYVADDGSFKALTPGDSYLWAGPKLEARLFFDSGPLDRLSFGAKYFYLYDFLSDDSQNIDYGQFDAKYALDEAETIALEARYTTGNKPRTLSEVDELYFGLTVKLGDLAQASGD
jgi:hypothetical protein